MHCQVPNEIGMLIDYLQLLTGVVVVHSDLSIISSHYDPLLASNEFSASDWSISHFKRPNLGLLIVIEDSHVSSV